MVPSLPQFTILRCGRGLLLYAAWYPWSGTHGCFPNLPPDS
jgi:hypothetical protein